MARRRKHLVCAVALDGYHVWQTPEARHGLGPMFAECRACGAVLWTPKQLIVSDGRRGTVHEPMAVRVSPQEEDSSAQALGTYPQHIAGAPREPDERDDIDDA